MAAPGSGVGKLGQRVGSGWLLSLTPTPVRIARVLLAQYIGVYSEKNLKNSVKTDGTLQPAKPFAGVTSR